MSKEILGTNFDVDPKRYTILNTLGSGAYGVVVSAKDLVTGEDVAIKKINKVFDHLTDAKRILREIKLLRHMDHENVIGVKDIFKPKDPTTYDDVYIVSELMEADLHKIIRSTQQLTDDHFQYFIYQTLRGLKYIHSAGVLHRDLKPSNLLVNANCDLKICDFGLARAIRQPESAENNFYTEYVATRWYRAPEIILSWKEYTKAVDIWSVGTILAELLARKPLFPGRDSVHQLKLITEVLGTPTEDDLRNIGSDKAKRYMKTLEVKKAVPLEKLFPSANPLAIDLLKKMLEFNPDNRITVEAALAHPYLASLHDPEDEPECPTQISLDFESTALTKPLLRELIFKEALDFEAKKQH